MPLTPLVLAHAAAALAAVPLGAMMLLARKGTSLHRYSGRLWVLLMVLVALSSFGIRSKGHFSLIHLLSIGTLLVLAWALAAVYRHRISQHRRAMRGAYLGLLIAGGFALMPNRGLGALLWQAVQFSN